MPLYGIPLLNAKNQSNEHICANSIACNASFNHWCYPVLLLFGDEKTKYRYIPEWQIAIELQSRFPDLPLICDPSHITGRRDMILEVSQQALDLNYDGLIIETHIDPDNAWSDAKQQIAPERLSELLDALIWRSETTTEQEFITALTTLREQINQLDDELLTILGQRMKISDKIGAYKKNNNITILQTNRWNDILQKAFKKGAGLGLSEEFITKYFDAIHLESINHQNNVMNK